MKTSSMVAASLIACVGALGIWQPWHRTEKPERRQTHGAEETEATPETRASRPVRVFVPAVEAAPPPPEAEDTPPPRATSRPAPVSAREAFAHVRSRFDAEKTDRAWSPRAEQSVRDKVGSLIPPGGSLRSAECRASMCRVEVTLGSEQDRLHFRQSAFMSDRTQIWDGPSTIGPIDEDDPNNPGVVAYMTRKDEPIPSR
jgi:hypothetical protein